MAALPQVTTHSLDVEVIVARLLVLCPDFPLAAADAQHHGGNHQQEAQEEANASPNGHVDADPQCRVAPSSLRGTCGTPFLGQAAQIAFIGNGSRAVAVKSDVRAADVQHLAIHGVEEVLNAGVSEEGAVSLTRGQDATDQDDFVGHGRLAV